MVPGVLLGLGVGVPGVELGVGENALVIVMVLVGVGVRVERRVALGNNVGEGAQRPISAMRA